MWSLHHLAKLGRCNGTIRLSFKIWVLPQRLFSSLHLTSQFLSRSVSQMVEAPSQNQQQDLFENLQDLLKSSSQFRKSRVNLCHLDKLHQLVVLLQRHPEVSADVWRAGIVPLLMESKDCGQLEVEHQARLALTLLGYTPPCSGRGIRILSVDGGGTRWAWKHSLVL